MSNYLSLRSSNAPASMVNMVYSTLTGSSIVGSTITVKSVTLNSTLTGSTLVATANVGIGTAAPTRTLDVRGNVLNVGGTQCVGEISVCDAITPANGYLRFTTAGGANYIQSGSTITGNSKAPLVFGSIYGDTEWMRITTAGNVGIGTAIPSAPLTVFGSSPTYFRSNDATYTTCYSEWRDYGATGRLLLGCDGNGLLNFQVGAGVFGTWGATNVYLTTAATARMTILSDGNVGIGTTVPGATLHIYNPTTGHPAVLRLVNNTAAFGSSANGPRLEFYTTFTGNNTQYFQGAIESVDDVTTDSSYGGLRFRVRNNTTDTEVMRLASSGYVGIGTATPVSRFEVRNGGAAGDNYSIYTSSYFYPTYVTGDPVISYRLGWYNDTWDIRAHRSGGFPISDLSFAVNSSEKMRITTGGNVGIGTATPVSKLHIAGVSTTADGLCVEGNVANSAISKTVLTGRASATLMPGMDAATSNLYFYASNSAGTPYYYIVAMSPLFTGQHVNEPVDPILKTNLTEHVGLIVRSNGTYCSRDPYTKEYITGKDAIAITESLPRIELTNKDKDKAVWGVITNVKNQNYKQGGGLIYDDDTEWDQDLGTGVRVNGLGEGAIWVTDINGPLENGDYICASIVPGYGRRQDDDLLHNYTVAKITMDCTFDLSSTEYRCEEYVYQSVTYRRAFVGCTYHCS